MQRLEIAEPHGFQELKQALRDLDPVKAARWCNALTSLRAYIPDLQSPDSPEHARNDVVSILTELMQLEPVEDEDDEKPPLWQFIKKRKKGSAEFLLRQVSCKLDERTHTAAHQPSRQILRRDGLLGAQTV